jgi:addiction module HigA family antidote
MKGVAKAIGVPQIRISEIVDGKRAITPDTALRLSRYFGTSTEFWMGMQTTYDLEISRRECIRGPRDCRSRRRTTRTPARYPRKRAYCREFSPQEPREKNPKLTFSG